jgi:hypothetical protein
MTAPSSRGFGVGLFLLALAFHLAIVSQDFSVLAKNGFLYDDSFYAFKIAQNIAHGSGATFDGVHPTNGFQPLYVLLLVPLYWLAGSDHITPIYLALMLCALATALTALVLFKILRRYVTERVALIASAVWVFSPVVTRQTANGLETSLALLALASVAYYYLHRIRSNEHATTREFMTLGALVGLAVLARVDQIFVALALLLDYLLVVRKREQTAPAVRGVLMAMGAYLLVYSPWVLFNYLSMGTMVQDSGTATRFLAIAYAPFFDLGSSQMVDVGPTFAFVWGHVTKALAVLKIAPPAHVLFRAIEKVGLSLGLPGAIGIVTSTLGLGIVALMAYVARREKHDPCMRRIGELRFLLIAMIALMAAYSFYVFGVFFFIRYLYPVYFLVCILAAFYAQLLFKRVNMSSVPKRAAAVGLMAVYVVAFAYMSYSSAFRSHPIYYFYDVASWIEKNTFEDDTIGVFQGGAIGYLSTRKVINLDGKVNHDALVALRNKKMASYVEDNHIDVILDHDNVLSLFLGGRDNPGRLARAGYERITDGDHLGMPGWSAYRINSHFTQTELEGYTSPKASSALR